MSDARVSCGDYRALLSSRRCESYIEGGTCRRPDRFLCTEWERVNAHRLPRASGSRAHLRVIHGGNDERADAAQRGWRR